jgi:hypothetical protein
VPVTRLWSSPSVIAPNAGQHDSRDACPVRSLVPERFRGGCPFGAPCWPHGVSPGRYGRLAPSLPERQVHISSHWNTRTAISVSTAANASSRPMAGSAEAGPSPRAITFCMPITR